MPKELNEKDSVSSEKGRNDVDVQDFETDQPIATLQSGLPSTTNTLAYDNIDVELKHCTPTVEKPGSHLLHMTSGTLLPLQYGVRTEDLSYSKFLWERSRFNHWAEKSMVKPIDYQALARLYQEPNTPSHPSGLFRRQ